MAIGVLTALALADAAPSDAATAATESSEATRFDLRIERLPLDEALQEFARQSGVQILFFSQATSGLSAPALTGEYTLSAALERLLAGSGLSFRVINPHTVEIRQSAPAQPTERPAVAPAASPPPTPTPAAVEEVVVAADAQQLVATRIPTPVQDIPQSIVVVSPEQIRDQNDFDLSDVMQHAVGVVSRHVASDEVNFFARGFEVESLHIDGGAALGSGFFSGNPDLSEFERVEILRGSDALFSENANPGATVSLVRKQPLGFDQVEVNVEEGSWHSHRAEVDATGPLNSEGTLRARADVEFADHDYFYDTASARRSRIFGVLEWDVLPGATLTAGGSYQRDHDVPSFGIPSLLSGAAPALPRGMGLTPDWAFVHTGTTEAYVQYRQQLAPGWDLKVNAASWNTSESTATGTIFADNDPSAYGLWTEGTVYSKTPELAGTHTVDFTLTGALDWFGLHESVAFGADFTRFTDQTNFVDDFPVGPELTDLRDFNPGAYPDPLLPAASAQNGDVGLLTTRELDYGVFTATRVELTRALALTLGLRVASDHIRNGYPGQVGIDSTGYSNVTTPLAGVMYRLNEHYSWYASYADVYLSTDTSQRPGGAFMGPAHGINLETGLKAAWLDGLATGSLVLYRIAQRNLPVYTSQGNQNLPFCCNVSDTESSHGVELEIDGTVAPGWLVGGGYSYNIHGAEVLSETELASPNNLVKLWTSVRLPGKLSNWTLGGDVEGQSRMTLTGQTQCGGPAGCGILMTQSPYAIVDLRVARRIDDHWQLSLRVNNVFDKTYYESIEETGLSYFYGDPRNVTLRVDAKL